MPICHDRNRQIENEHTKLNFIYISFFPNKSGAHISGNAGANYQSLNNGSNSKIARITGLDPAGPLFYFSAFPFPKLNKDNAVFVDIIHTNGGELGDTSVDGDIDFYPNGGSQQPGCNPLTRNSSISSSIQ
jgi:hypothetical protein